MKKPEIIQVLIDEHNFTEEELKDLTYPELRAYLKKCKTEDLGGLDIQEESEAESKKTQPKKYYPKDNLFGQVIQDTDRKNLKAIETEVDYRIIKFKSGFVKFVKDEAVSKENLALMSDYQKEFYLDAK